MKDGAEDRLRRRLVWVFDGIHGGFEVMGFERYGDLADFGHALLGRVLWVFLNHALFLGGFSVVFFEETVADPSLARAGK